MLLSEFGIENIKVGDEIWISNEFKFIVTSVDKNGATIKDISNGIMYYGNEGNIYILKRNGKYIIKDGKLVKGWNKEAFEEFRNGINKANKIVKNIAENIKQEENAFVDEEDIIDKQVAMLRKFKKEFPCNDELLQVMAAKIFDYLKEKEEKSLQ